MAAAATEAKESGRRRDESSNEWKSEHEHNPFHLLPRYIYPHAEGIAS